MWITFCFSVCLRVIFSNCTILSFDFCFSLCCKAQKCSCKAKLIGISAMTLLGARVVTNAMLRRLTNSGVAPIGQGWTNVRALRGLGPAWGPSLTLKILFVYFNISSVRCQPSILLYSSFFVNDHFAFHHCFVFNGNFS